MESPLLRIRHLHKSYAVPVLIDVDLDLYAGEVHALVGANGAGKSTLARILCGLTDRNSGLLELCGKDYRPRSKGDAEAAGVQMVMQELNLVGTLSIAENLFFNRLPHRFGFINVPELYRETRRALGAVGLEDLDPRLSVSRLGVGKQQLLEIAAALARPCRLLILDEPTAALTDPEIDLLFEHIRRLKKEGVSIIYISHRMEEIRRITDRVTVLRDGQVVETAPTAELSLDRIIQLMVGHDMVDRVDLGERSTGSVALRVEGLTCGALVREVSFEVCRGEILGFAGLVGSGRTETMRAIFGADQPEAGRVLIARPGAELRPVEIHLPRDAVKAGIGMIPEDRKQQGLFLPQSIRLNSTLARMRSVTQPKYWIHRVRERRAAQELSNRLQVHRQSVEQPVVELSGGNQQKVIIARWLLRDCDVLLFDEPTRGIDVAAKNAIYHLLGELAAQGKALVVVSSELRELMAICDRIAVMSAGRIAATFGRGEWTEDKIMSAAISGYLDRFERTPGAEAVSKGAQQV